MKIFFWFYLAGSLIVAPLLIFDMYQQRKINFTIILLIVLLVYFYKQAFRKENMEEGDG